jgi:hypothetical protein
VSPQPLPQLTSSAMHVCLWNKASFACVSTACYSRVTAACVCVCPVTTGDALTSFARSCCCCSLPSARCPLCRQPIRANQLRAAAKPATPEPAGAAGEGGGAAQEEEAPAEPPRCVLCDSKLKALLKVGGCLMAWGPTYV